MIFLSQPRFAASRPHEAALRVEQAGGWGRRSGPEPFGADAGQRVRDRLVERREAQPLSPKGARVPRQASQPCLERRAERALARPVRGLANPWRLPALHRPLPMRRARETGTRRTPRPKFKRIGAGGALASVIALQAAVAIVRALTHKPLSSRRDHPWPLPASTSSASATPLST
jgi:hypothetical protein